MKTKIVMMTALLALLAAGCGKDNRSGHIRILAENMTAASNGSKLQIDADDPASSSQWLLGEIIDVNGSQYDIESDGNGGFQLDISSESDPYFAVYPGDEFGGNSLHVDNSNPAEPEITLSNLVLNFHAGETTHDVVFPMGAQASDGDDVMIFKHLTAGFRLTLTGTSVTLTKLKVIVYGDDVAGPVDVDGVNYTVAWEKQGPSVPTGNVGSLTDRDVRYASEMNFDLKTDGSTPSVTFTGNKYLCIPVTLATVKRITVIGYNGSTQVFAKTSTLADDGVELVRNKMYPVAAIQVN